MDESSSEMQPARRIVKRQNGRAVVGSRRPSALSQLAVRAVPAALLALGTVAGGRAVVNDIGKAIGGENGDGGVTVNILPREAHAMEPEKVQQETGLFDTVFHDLNSNQQALAQAEVTKYEGRITAKSNFKEVHADIPLRYESVIEQTAKAYGISKDTLMGLIGTENGGGVAVENASSGALGVAQFLPKTAREYGLIVGNGIDQRSNPELSIAAAGKYLEVHKELFGGDEGMAIWSYHAGAGNVFAALRVYFQDVNNVDIGDYAGAIDDKDPVAREQIETMARKLIDQEKVDIWKLFSNELVRENVLSRLKDYSESYPFTVVAMAKLINEYKAQNGLAGGGLEGRQADLGGGLKIRVANTPVPSPLD